MSGEGKQPVACRPGLAPFLDSTKASVVIRSPMNPQAVANLLKGDVNAFLRILSVAFSVF
jgi:hypothetical protein